MLKGNPPALDLIAIYLVVLVLLTAQAVFSQESIKSVDLNDNLSNVQITKNISSMPLAFTANQGQWDDEVLFRANANGATMWFSTDGAYYQFTRTIESENRKPISIVDKRYGMMPDEITDRQPGSVETIMIKASFVGANSNLQLVGVDIMEYKCNYFIGNDPNKWQTDVPNYSALLYEQVYDGIDLKYYGNGRQMEYDFIVSPGADYSQIEIRYEGAESISINDNGELVVKTKWGEVVEQRPVIYQIENSSRIAVAGEYRMKGDNSFGFELSSSYNPALPLVIDPVLSYSTYLGGSSSDYGYGIAVDGSGNVYITGGSPSTNFPTEGEYQTYQGSWDVFVTKLNSSGSALVYSTYLGGSGSDGGHGIAVDGSGNAYIAGFTLSTDFPTEGAYQTDQGGWDVFVTKLNSSGNALVYSTYLGGTGTDLALEIALDGSGNAFVTGYTDSPDFPTQGEYQAYQGNLDVFVTKLNSFGNALVYSTYLGGAGDDYGKGIALDGSGNAYITGYTRSTDFPTEGEYQPDQAGFDVFVTKLNFSGNALVHSTYLGGADNDFGSDIALDGSGNAYLTGWTFSTDFPTDGAYEIHQGSRDVFVTKLNSSGNALIYSTFLGGSGSDEGEGIVVDGLGYAYITGNTTSNDFPTVDAYQTQQSSVDAFVTRLSSFGHFLVFSTYLGGADNDLGLGIAVDASGNTYITGVTLSTNFPIQGEYQTDQGWLDVYVTKFAACCVGDRGDLNGDGIDAKILDLTFLVDRIFRGGPAPACPEEADVNGDGRAGDILDMTFLVDFIFRGGGPLVPC